jgi:hypothetical protein
MILIIHGLIMAGLMNAVILCECYFPPDSAQVLIHDTRTNWQDQLCDESMVLESAERFVKAWLYERVWPSIYHPAGNLRRRLPRLIRLSVRCVLREAESKAHATSRR